MAFGVKRGEAGIDTSAPKRNIVPAVTTETTVALVLVAGLFAAFTWKMGLANMFKTMMGTAHDLVLNTVLFLMGVIILAGAFTSFLAEFGIVGIANRLLSPLMKPLFGLPGATSVGVVATYLSDNPAIMPLGSDKGFLKYFKRWQLTTLVNLGTVFGMGLIVTTFMLAQSSGDAPLARAVLLGNLGAILGGIVSVRLMGYFGKRKYGREASVLTEEEEGYDILRFRQVREDIRTRSARERDRTTVVRKSERRSHQRRLWSAATFPEPPRWLETQPQLGNDKIAWRRGRMEEPRQ